jgi:Cu+-exporting ATPase
LNFHGALSVRVARAGGDTALARIAHAVEDAQGRKAPIARLADRVSAYFVPAVLVIAAGTGIAWWLAGSPLALERAVAVLVIACPCALGLATPAAVAVGTSRGAELGVLFAGGDALERASRIDVVCVDKTGTLTTGKPVVVGDIADEVLCLAASVEQASEHPFARAIVDEAKRRGLPLSWPTQVKADVGEGITGIVDGKTVAISRAGISIDGKEIAAIHIADTPRDGARETIDKLRAMHVEAVMVTGDNDAAAKAIADAVGITKIHADVRPTSKAAIVDGERWGGHHVAMVGDGINDAPALAAADVGIAIGSGAELAAAAADITLLRDGIRALPTALALARATLHTIRRNLVAAFAYNLVCIPIAAAGLASPMYAAAAMSLSSVSVLASSLRLKRFVP